MLHATILSFDAAPSARLGLIILELVMEVRTGSVLAGTPILRLHAADAFDGQKESGPWVDCCARTGVPSAGRRSTRPLDSSLYTIGDTAAMSSVLTCTCGWSDAMLIRLASLMCDEAAPMHLCAANTKLRHTV